MTAERENCASRRALLKGAPALAVIAAVAAETGMSIASTADPYIALCAEHERWRQLQNLSMTDEQADAAYESWVAVEDRLSATRATTPVGAAAGLRTARAEFIEFFSGATYPGGRFIIALMDSAIAVLDRETARV